MSEIRAVAFDVGNVLLDWAPEVFIRGIAGAAGLDIARTQEAALRLFWREKRRIDLGDLAPSELHAELNALAREMGGREIELERMLALWCEGLRPRPGVTPLVRRLRPGVDHAIWSNTDPIHFAFWSRWLPFLSGARSIWVSFLAGTSKPDRAFYEGGLRALGRRADEVLFLDDLEANVDAARALGIEAERVASLAEVEGALARRGLLRD